MTAAASGFLGADPGYSALLASLPAWAFAFVMVLGRVGAAVTLLPGLGEADLPAPVRLGVALAICVLLLPGLAPLMPPQPQDAGRLAAMVAAEVVAGLWLGWLARLVSLALPLAGQLVSYMIGLASVLQTDPLLGAQTTALGRLFSLAAPVLLLASGLYAVPVAALAASYDVLRPGEMLPAGAGASSVAIAVAASFALAFQLAAPFVLSSLVWQVAIGLTARLVPRVQVYFAGLPGQLLTGLTLLAALSGAIAAGFQSGVRDAFSHLPGMG